MSQPPICSSITLMASLLLLGGAHACSDVSLTYGHPDAGHVSARTMDYDAYSAPDFDTAVTAFPVGSVLKQHHVLGGNASSIAPQTAPAAATVGFVGMQLRAIGGALADGMNEHGLSVGALWLEHPADPNNFSPGTGVGTFGDYYPSFDPADPRPPVANVDLAGRLLGSCKTIEEVVAFVRTHQIVATEDTAGTFAAVGWCNATPECNPAFHLTLHDGQGKSAVIEFVGEASKAAAPECFADPSIGGEKAAPNGGRVCIYDNTAGGVLTNEPTLELQRRGLSERVRRTDRLRGEGGASERALLRLLRHEYGGYEPVARFGRLSLLNTLGQRASSAATPDGFSFESADPSTRTVARAARQIGSVAVPFGAGGTQWTVIRDHTHKRLLFGSPASVEGFQSVDVTALRLGTPGPARSITLADRNLPVPDASAGLINNIRELTFLNV